MSIFHHRPLSKGKFADEECWKCCNDQAKCSRFTDVKGLISETGESFGSVKVETAGKVNPCDQIGGKEHLKMDWKGENVQRYQPETQVVSNKKRNEDDQ
jgi:hypothetical protein